MKEIISFKITCPICNFEIEESDEYLIRLSDDTFTHLCYECIEKYEEGELTDEELEKI